MIDEEDGKRCEKILRSAVQALGEHFDSVQVVATKRADNGKHEMFISDGYGNLYARQGSVRHWLVTQEEYTREAARHNMFVSEDEEDDDA